jgi:hypothetical protein
LSAPWVSRVGSFAAAPGNPLYRNGNEWGEGTRALRGVLDGSTLFCAAAGQWTMPGADVTVIYVCRPVATYYPVDWITLCSGANGLCHVQWGIRGTAANADAPGLESWAKNNVLQLAARRLRAGNGWGNRYVCAFRAVPPVGISMRAITGGALYARDDANGYNGAYSSTAGCLLGSPQGAACGFAGDLRAILAVAGAVSDDDLMRVANYYDVTI